MDGVHLPQPSRVVKEKGKHVCVCVCQCVESLLSNMIGGDTSMAFRVKL